MHHILPVPIFAGSRYVADTDLLALPFVSNDSTSYYVRGEARTR
jgi:hypothetical protein